MNNIEYILIFLLIIIINSCNNSKKEKYYSSGELHFTYDIRDNKLNGKVIEYNKNGSIKGISEYKNNLLNGKTTIFYNEVVIQELNYDSGKLEGTQKFFYENGKLKIIAEALKDKFDGKFIEYYENGNIKQDGFYSNDLEDGKWVIYNESGQKKATGNYKFGFMDGEWTYYSRNIKKVQWSTFNSAYNDLAINIPNNWVLDESIPEAVLLAVDTNNVKANNSFSIIVNENVSAELDVIVEENISKLYSDFSQYNFTLISKDNFDINGLNSKWISLSVKRDGIDKIGLIVVVKENDQVFIFNFYINSQFYNDYYELYKEILYSIEVGNGSHTSKSSLKSKKA